MKGLEKLADILREEGARMKVFDQDGRCLDFELFASLLNSVSCWSLAYRAEQIQAVSISDSLAKVVGVPGGVIRAEDEMLFVNHCDPATSLHRLSVFEHFSSGAINSIHGVASIHCSDETVLNCHDLAAPLAFDSTGKVTYYVHLICDMQALTIAHAHNVFEVEKLSPRQTEALALLLAGTPPTQIAHEMEISPRTLEKHSKATFEIAGVPNQRSLIRLVQLAQCD